MKINSQYLKQLGGLGIATATRHWMGTLDYRYVAYDESVDPAGDQFKGPAIFLFWHEYIPFLFYLRGHCRIAMLVSKHGDAEWLSCAAKHMGFSLVRGSTNRGGAKAMRELMASTQAQSIAITPDGPRGPRRRLAAGPIYLASRTGLPIVACGLGYSSCWRMKTWDRLAVPKPGARGRVVASPFVQIPEKLDREGIEHHRQSIEKLLNRLTEQAEVWAEQGVRMDGERPAQRKPMSWQSAMRRRNHAADGSDLVSQAATSRPRSAA